MAYIPTPSDDANEISDAVKGITRELARMNHTLEHIKERLESIDDSLVVIKTAKKCVLEQYT